MRVDLYTKTVLTIATLLLALIAWRDLAMPPNTRAAGALDGVQFMSHNGPASSGFWAIDTRSGDVWLYVRTQLSGEVKYMGKLRQLGKALEDR
jgi:hypothetical protein